MMSGGRPEVSGQYATMQAPEDVLAGLLGAGAAPHSLPIRRVYFRIPVSLMNATQRFTSDS